MDDLVEQIGADVLPSQRGDVYRMLSKVLGNITEKPSEPKFRTLKKDNKKISDTLLKHPAVVSILMAAGFEDQGETLHCPDTADLGAMEEAVALLECFVASCEGAEQVAPASTPAHVSPGAPRPTAATARAEKTNPTGFARRKDDEKERQHAADQLAALRGTRAQAIAPAPQPEGAVDGSKKPIKSAFDFENRRAKEEQRSKGADSLEDLRRAQKEKYQEFQDDPNAREADVYKQPASVAGNGKVDQGWGGWLGGMFGGSSSGSSGGGGGGGRPSNDRPGPRIKGMGDLPKPPPRGGG